MLLNINDACRLLGINPQTLRRWESEGKIFCVRTEGGQRRVAQEEVARILGCDPEEIEVHEQAREALDLKKKRLEVESLRLDVKKEKAVKVLSKIKGNAVKKARDEYELMRIERAKEELMADKAEEEEERKHKQRRQAWVAAWTEYAYKCLDPLPHIFPNLMAVTEPKPILLSLKIRVRKEVLAFLEDIDIDEDTDEVRLQIEQIVSGICDSRNKESQKREAINYVMSWLHNRWPLWLESRAAALLGGYVRRTLEQTLTGSEEIEEADEMAEKLRDEIISMLRGLSRDERVRAVERLSRSMRA